MANRVPGVEKKIDFVQRAIHSKEQQRSSQNEQQLKGETLEGKVH